MNEKIIIIQANCKADMHNSRNVGIGWKIASLLLFNTVKIAWLGRKDAFSTRMTREKGFFSCDGNTNGHDRCHRALRPIRLLRGARRPELVQPAGATEALHEHSGVHAAKLSGSFFFSAELASS